MNKLSRILGFTCMVMLSPMSTVQGAAENTQPKMEKAVHDLQEAKQSKDPMPLLEAAKKALKHASKNKHGGRAAAIGLVDQAIQEAASGDKEKMRQKIDAAIANIHNGMSKAD